jgi:hypothetical protein
LSANELKYYYYFSHFLTFTPPWLKIPSLSLSHSLALSLSESLALMFMRSFVHCFFAHQIVSLPSLPFPHTQCSPLRSVRECDAGVWIILLLFVEMRLMLSAAVALARKRLLALCLSFLSSPLISLNFFTYFSIISSAWSFSLSRLLIYSSFERMCAVWDFA